MTSPADHAQPYRTVLVGAGVVGRAIALAHLQRGIITEMVDVHGETLRQAGEFLRAQGALVHELPPFEGGGQRISVVPASSKIIVDGPAESESPRDMLVIESIAERRELKRAWVEATSRQFGDRAILATNTSSLRLSDLATAAARPDRFCGMHFFMPVVGRDLVEIVRTPHTSDQTMAIAARHASRLGKAHLLVADSPGFVVNRLLSPYLNQAMLMLGAGADHRLIRAVAIRFGMPMSPLELIDLIGIRTAFDAGRAAWQAFPGRIDPAPILPGMIKAGLGGRAAGHGFYAYALDPDARETRLADAEQLHPQAAAVIAKYERHPRSWTEAEATTELFVPMLVEAASVLRERVIESVAEVELAMRGGLGFATGRGFFEALESIGAQNILRAIAEAGSEAKAMSAPRELVEAIQNANSIEEGVMRFASADGR